MMTKNIPFMFFCCFVLFCYVLLWLIISIEMDSGPLFFGAKMLIHHMDHRPEYY